MEDRLKQMASVSGQMRYFAAKAEEMRVALVGIPFDMMFHQSRSSAYEELRHYQGELARLEKVMAQLCA